MVDKQMSKFKLPGFIFILLITILFFSCAPSRKFMVHKGKTIATDKSYIKVLIINKATVATVTSKARIKISILDSQKIIYNNKGKKLKFFPEKIKKPLLVESWGAPLYVNNKPYRGMIEIHNILGKLNIVNVLRLDEYLFGVVPSEMSASWHHEAVKAQAVAARTYAYYHLLKKNNTAWDLDATVNFQRYKGMSVESDNTNSAVKETSGEILVYQNKPILAFFHSTCGGRTISSKYVWHGEDLPYLATTKCTFCKASPHYNWREAVSLFSIRSSLRKKYRDVAKIKKVTFKRIDDRVIGVIIKHGNGIINMKGNEFRMLFPTKKIKSLFFNAEKTKKGLLLVGHGWGHGVGMCQYGAQGMAMQRIGYRKILKYYYKGVNIIKIKR